MSKAFRIGLLGVGPMAAQHARAIRAVPGLELTASVSRDPAKAQAFAAKHQIARSAGLAEFLDAPGVDGIYVVVPAEAMHSVAAELAKLAIPLFLEKPVGMTPAETRWARDCITVPHMVGMNRRFYEIVQRGKKLLDERGGATGIEIHMPESIRPLDQRYGSHVLENWMFGNSIHLIDMFRFFAGEPTEVSAMRRQRSWHDLSVVASLAFESGALGVFHAHWGAPGGWRVAVTAEDIQIVFQPIERATVLVRGKESIVMTPTGQDSQLKAGLFGEAEAFAGLIATGRLRSPAADLADYARSVDLVDRIFGGQVAIPEVGR